MILQVNGVELSSVPTTNHKQLIHIRLDKQLQRRLKKIQTETQNPTNHFTITSYNHIKAYVDPSDLSYNSFENILQMDSCFFGPRLNANSQLNLAIEKMEKKENYFQFKIHDPVNILMELHKMDLYTLPFNNLSRGGKRMIFSSIKLADILYQGIKFELEQNLKVVQKNNELQFADLHNDFNSVNHVFRLNSFSPSSGNFKSHYDTPFSDEQRKLFSKFTLLIYLTGGSNEEKGCLRIKDKKINEIPEFTGIIFDQRHEHQGWPYLQGDKVFLRTELIYFIKNATQDGRVAEFFNRACYFQKQAYTEHSNNEFAIELQKYSNDLFNHTAKLRYSLAEKSNQILSLKQKTEQDKEVSSVERKYLMKQNLGVVYVTDGNSFWFRQAVPVQQAAKLVLADYFNGRVSQLTSKPVPNNEIMKIHSKPLNLQFKSHKQQKMEIEEDQATKREQEQNLIDLQIIQYLDGIAVDGNKSLIQYPYDFGTIVNSGNKDFDLQKEHCRMQNQDDTTNSLPMQIQSRQISLGRLKTKMNGIGVVLFNGKLHIDDSKVSVNEAKGEISFNNTALNQTINFAACQCDSYRMNQIIGKQTVQIEGFLLPKMNYRKFTHCKGYKISIDIFKNGFIHRINTKISRPYALDPQDGQIKQPFYDYHDDYIDSDNDYEEFTGKKYQDPEAMEEEEDDDNFDWIKKKNHS